ncbi:hypothetical protein Tco_0506698 [Tanacetum coccineum]
MNIDEVILFSFVNDKLPLSWKDFKHTLKHKKEESTYVELGSQLRLEELTYGAKIDKLKSNNVMVPSTSGTDKDSNVEVHGKVVDQQLKLRKKAVNDEMDSIMGNDNWVLIDLPPGCKPLGCKWFLKRKMKVDGTVKKFKARFVSPFIRYHNMLINQMDVKITFLNGKLNEEVDMSQPQGFIMPVNERMCEN